jgi:hypothetical protein
VIGESLDTVDVRPHTMPNLGSALDRVWGEGAGVNYGAAAASPAWSGYGTAASPAWSGWDPDTLWRPTGWSNSPLC